ncbi:MAG: HAD-IIIC family phosphatase, partial [Deltaproteobacteria bacterium]|nr:HAD-IIIC family phosphatase [Deltaproteobacteria bacterium]
LTDENEEARTAGLSVRIAVLRSFSCELLPQMLTVEAHHAGFACRSFLGGYGQYAQEILDSQGELHAFQPDVAILAVSIEDLIPSLSASCYADLAKIPALAEKALSEYAALVDRLRALCRTAVFVCNFVAPDFSPVSTFLNRQGAGPANVVRKANLELARVCVTRAGVYPVDLSACVNEIGRQAAYDATMWFVAKNPYSPALYSRLAGEITSMLTACYGRRKKCLVLDMDNTLWRGLAGEDGLGVKITPDFQELQRQILHWTKTGIILAANSKNNMADVLEILEKHPDMLLRKQDFAAMQINWDDKATNMRRIAEELNIGPDSLVFLDDSHAECELIRQALPMVTVVHLDGNSASYAGIVQNMPELNFVAWTAEDSRRAAGYQEQNTRNAHREQFTDLASYLQSLEMRLEFAFMNDKTLPRVAQLTQKTNQFNLTTRRYTESDIIKLCNQGVMIITVTVSDKFGDSGLTGCVFVDTTYRRGTHWRIDNCILSCRVMSRNVEDALFGQLLRLAREAGVETIIGEFIPTAKNKPVERLYERWGFTAGDGYWEYPVTKEFDVPAYFEQHFVITG